MKYQQILLFSLFFTFLVLYNYILPLDGLLPDRDYELQLWDIWFANESITHGQNPYFTELQYYPVGAHLGRHVLSPGFFPLTFLIQILSGGDSLYPLYTYKVIILLSYALILGFSYLVLREIGLTNGPALLAATAYGFSSFYLHHMFRIHIISGFFIPLIAFFFIRLFKKPTLINALYCAILASSGLYFTELTLFVYMALFFLTLILLAWPSTRSMFMAKVYQLGLKNLAITTVVFVLGAAFFAYNWLRSDANPPDPQEAFRYSSNLAGFFIPAPSATPLYGGPLFAWLNQFVTVGVGGYEIFMGFPLLIFGLIAIFTLIKQPVVRIALILALIFLGLSLGPTLKIFGLDTHLPLPYALLASIPPFNVGRTPVRFVAMAFFFWMIVAAYGLQSFQGVMSRYGRMAALLAMLIIFCWITAEVYVPVKPQLPYVIPAQLNQLTPGPVINLPLRRHDSWALLLQMFHHQPIATGYVSRNSKKQDAHFETLRVLYAEALATGSCQKFIELGYRNIVIGMGVPDDIVLGLTQSTQCPLNLVDLRQP